MTSETAPRPDRVAVYVDGFNLYFGLKAKQWRRYYWLDMHLLARHLLTKRQSLAAVNYFTADITGPKNKRERQQIYLDALTTHGGVEIIRGRYLMKERQCRRCGNVIKVPEEKKTDAAIATRLVSDAFRDIFDTAIVISGDSDLVPPIEEVHRHLPDKRVVVAFPPTRVSRELARKAHKSFPIYEKTLRISQLPNVILKPNGYELRRPPRWR